MRLELFSFSFRCKRFRIVCFVRFVVCAVRPRGACRRCAFYMCCAIFEQFAYTPGDCVHQQVSYFLGPKPGGAVYLYGVPTSRVF